MATEKLIIEIQAQTRAAVQEFEKLEREFREATTANRQLSRSFDDFEKQFTQSSNALRRGTLSYRQELNRLSAEIAENKQAMLKADSTAKETLATKNKQIQSEQALIRVQQQSASISLATMTQQRRELKGLSAEFDVSTQSAGKFRGALGEMGAMLGAFAIDRLVSEMINFGRASVDAAVQVDSAKRAFETLTGSAEKAEIQLKEIQRLSDMPGLRFESALHGATALRAIDVPMETTTRILTELGNAAAFSGNQMGEFERGLLGFRQIIQRGRVSQEELNQLTENLGVVSKAIKEEFGTVLAEEIQESLDAAGQNIHDFVERVLSAMERLDRFDANAASVKFQQLGNSIYEFQAAVGEDLTPVLGKGADALRAFLDTMTETKLAGPTASIGALGAAFGGFALTMKTFTGSTGLGGLGTTVAKALGHLGTQAGFAGTAVVTLVEAWRQIYSDFQKTAPFEDAVTSIQKFNVETSETAKGLGLSKEAFASFSTETQSEIGNLLSRADELRTSLRNAINSGDTEAAAAFREEYKQIAGQLEAVGSAGFEAKSGMQGTTEGIEAATAAVRALADVTPEQVSFTKELTDVTQKAQAAFDALTPTLEQSRLALAGSEGLTGLMRQAALDSTALATAIEGVIEPFRQVDIVLADVEAEARALKQINSELHGGLDDTAARLGTLSHNASLVDPEIRKAQIATRNYGTTIQDVNIDIEKIGSLMEDVKTPLDHAKLSIIDTTDEFKKLRTEALRPLQDPLDDTYDKLDKLFDTEPVKEWGIEMGDVLRSIGTELSNLDGALGTAAEGFTTLFTNPIQFAGFTVANVLDGLYKEFSGKYSNLATTGPEVETEIIGDPNAPFRSPADEEKYQNFLSILKMAGGIDFIKQTSPHMLLNIGYKDRLAGDLTAEQFALAYPEADSSVSARYRMHQKYLNTYGAVGAQPSADLLAEYEAMGGVHGETLDEYNARMAGITEQPITESTPPAEEPSAAGTQATPTTDPLGTVHRFTGAENQKIRELSGVIKQKRTDFTGLTDADFSVILEKYTEYTGAILGLYNAKMGYIQGAENIDAAAKNTAMALALQEYHALTYRANRDLEAVMKSSNLSLLTEFGATTGAIGQNQILSAQIETAAPTSTSPPTQTETEPVSSETPAPPIEPEPLGESHRFTSGQSGELRNMEGRAKQAKEDFRKLETDDFSEILDAYIHYTGLLLELYNKRVNFIDGVDNITAAAKTTAKETWLIDHQNKTYEANQILERVMEKAGLRLVNEFDTSTGAFARNQIIKGVIVPEGSGQVIKAEEPKMITATNPSVEAPKPLGDTHRFSSAQSNEVRNLEARARQVRTDFSNLTDTDFSTILDKYVAYTSLLQEIYDKRIGFIDAAPGLTEAAKATARETALIAFQNATFDANNILSKVMGNSGLRLVNEYETTTGIIPRNQVLKSVIVPEGSGNVIKATQPTYKTATSPSVEAPKPLGDTHRFSSAQSNEVRNLEARARQVRTDFSNLTDADFSTILDKYVEYTSLLQEIYDKRIGFIDAAPGLTEAAKATARETALIAFQNATFDANNILSKVMGNSDLRLVNEYETTTGIIPRNQVLKSVIVPEGSGNVIKATQPTYKTATSPSVEAPKPLGDTHRFSSAQGIELRNMENRARQAKEDFRNLDTDDFSEILDAYIAYTGRLQELYNTRVGFIDSVATITETAKGAAKETWLIDYQNKTYEANEILSRVMQKAGLRLVNEFDTTTGAFARNQIIKSVIVPEGSGQVIKATQPSTKTATSPSVEAPKPLAERHRFTSTQSGELKNLEDRARQKRTDFSNLKNADFSTIVETYIAYTGMLQDIYDKRIGFINSAPGITKDARDIALEAALIAFQNDTFDANNILARVIAASSEGASLATEYGATTGIIPQNQILRNVPAPAQEMQRSEPAASTAGTDGSPEVLRPQPRDTSLLWNDVQMADFMLGTSASESEFETNRGELRRATVAYYDAEIERIKELGLSLDEETDKLQDNSLARMKALRRIDEMENRYASERKKREDTEAREKEDALQAEERAKAKALQAEARAEAETQEKLRNIYEKSVDVEADRLKKLRELNQEYYDDIADLAETAAEKMFSATLRGDRSLEDLRHRLSRKMFSDVVSFGDLTDAQKAEVTGSLDYRRAEFDSALGLRRSREDIQREFGALREGTAGHQFYLEQLQAGTLTDPQLIERLFGTRGEDLMERYNEGVMDINTQTLVATDALRMALEEVVKPQNPLIISLDSLTAALNASGSTVATGATPASPFESPQQPTQISVTLLVDSEQIVTPTFAETVTDQQNRNALSGGDLR